MDTQELNAVGMPTKGDKAPELKDINTKGEINFPGDYTGKWVILFSHPADFPRFVLLSL